MGKMSRRDFLKTAPALGAGLYAVDDYSAEGSNKRQRRRIPDLQLVVVDVTYQGAPTSDYADNQTDALLLEFKGRLKSHGVSIVNNGTVLREIRKMPDVSFEDFIQYPDIVSGIDSDFVRNTDAVKAVCTNRGHFYTFGAEYIDIETGEVVGTFLEPGNIKGPRRTEMIDRVSQRISLCYESIRDGVL